MIPFAAAMTSTVVPCWAAIDARVSPATTMWVGPVTTGVAVVATGAVAAGLVETVICWPILIRLGLVRPLADTRESTVVPYFPAIPARVSPAETM